MTDYKNGGGEALPFILMGGACLIPFYLNHQTTTGRGGLASNLINGRRGTGPTVRYSIQASKLGSYK